MKKIILFTNMLLFLFVNSNAQSLLYPAIGMNGKYGYVDKKGDLIVEYIYDSAAYFSNDRALVEIDGFFGYIDKNAKMVIEPKYAKAFSFSDDFALVSDKDEEDYYFIDKTGEIAINKTFKNAYSFSDGCAMVKDLKSWKYIDKTGKTFLSLDSLYGYYYSFYNGLALKRKNEKYGFINKKGVEVIPCVYKDATKFYGDFALVSSDSDKWGYINKTGKLVIDTIYDGAWSFFGDYALIKQNNSFAFINKSGKIISEWYSNVNYEELFYLKNLPIYARIDDKCVFLDEKLKPISPIYDSSSYYHDYKNFNIGIVKKDGKYAYLNAQARKITDWFDELPAPKTYYGNDQTGILRNGNLFAVMHKNKIISDWYSDAFIFNSLATVFVKKDENWGNLDSLGQFIMNNSSAESVIDFDNRESVVLSKGSKFYLVDKNLKILSRGYDKIYKFSEGFAVVKQSKFYGYINSNGEEKIFPQYLDAYNVSRSLFLVKDTNKLYGYLDSTGKTIIDFEYDTAEPFTDLYADVTKKGVKESLYYYSYMSDTPQNNEVFNNSNEYSKTFLWFGFLIFPALIITFIFINRARNKRKAELMLKYMKSLKTENKNVTNKPSVKTNINSNPNASLKAIQNNGKYGFVDELGNIVINYYFDMAHGFTEDIAAVKSNGKWGYINKQGSVHIDFVYDMALPFAFGLAPVARAGKWGYINKKNETIIPFVYEVAYTFTEGLAAVRLEKKWGFINKNNQYVIKPVFTNAGIFAKGYGSVEYDTIWYRIDKLGNFYDRQLNKVKSPITDSILNVLEQEETKEKVVEKPITNLESLITALGEDKNSKDLNELKTELPKVPELPDVPNIVVEIPKIEIPVIKIESKNIEPTNVNDASKLSKDLIEKTKSDAINEDLIKYKKGFKFGIQKKNGDIITDAIYDEIGVAVNGMIKVKKNFKYGYLNILGEQTIDCIYDEISEFSNKVAKVKKSLKWGLIDNTGNLIGDIIYDSVESFNQKFWKVKKSWKFGLIDNDGRSLCEPIYDEIFSFKNNCAKVKRNWKFGMINITGEEFIECKYDQIDDFIDGKAAYKLMGKAGFINLDGEIVS